jgi:hypothetical protein
VAQHRRLESAHREAGIAGSSSAREPDGARIARLAALSAGPPRERRPEQPRHLSKAPRRHRRGLARIVAEHRRRGPAPWPPLTISATYGGRAPRASGCSPSSGLRWLMPIGVPRWRGHGFARRHRPAGPDRSATVTATPPRSLKSRPVASNAWPSNG